MRRLILSLFATAALYTYPAQAALEDYPSVKLQGLDKSVGRTVTFEARVGSTIQYGPLFIKIQSCRKAPPIEKPESAAFLQIWEVPPGKQSSEWVFSGWMFGSSPALSAMDHPVYDVWVLDCTGREEAPLPEGDTITVNGEDVQPDGIAADTQVDAISETPVTDSEAEEPMPADSVTETPPPPDAMSADTPPVETLPEDAATPNDGGAYAPDGGAVVAPAPSATPMPKTPMPDSTPRPAAPTPGTAYEFLDRSGAAQPRVVPRDNSTAYDYMSR